YFFIKINRTIPTKVTNTQGTDHVAAEYDPSPLPVQEERGTSHAVTWQMHHFHFHAQYIDAFSILHDPIHFYRNEYLVIEVSTAPFISCGYRIRRLPDGN